MLESCTTANIGPGGGSRGGGDRVRELGTMLTASCSHGIPGVCERRAPNALWRDASVNWVKT